MYKQMIGKKNLIQFLQLTFTHSQTMKKDCSKNAVWLPNKIANFSMLHALFLWLQFIFHSQTSKPHFSCTLMPYASWQWLRQLLCPYLLGQLVHHDVSDNKFHWSNVSISGIFTSISLNTTISRHNSNNISETTGIRLHTFELFSSGLGQALIRGIWVMACGSHESRTTLRGVVVVHE